MFRGVGEKQYLWQVLEGLNPWRISKNKHRSARWYKAAEIVMEVGTVDITDNDGKRTVSVDVCKDMVSFWRW